MKPFLLWVFAAMLLTPGCQHRAEYAVPPTGHFFFVQTPNGLQRFTIVDTQMVEGYAEAFRSAIPLASGLPSDAKADFEFTETLDGKILNKYALYRKGEILNNGRWYRVDATWHYRWRIMYDPEHAADFLQRGTSKQ